MKNIIVLNGPNLNLLGSREPDLYGQKTLAEINLELEAQGEDLGFRVSCLQSNYEGGCIEVIHQAKLDKVPALLINAGAFTHTSIAIRDALLACETVFIEIHVTNLAKREQFRHNSYLTDLALGSIMGFGALGYGLGLEALKRHFDRLTIKC